MDKLITYTMIGLGIIAAGLFIMLKISWSDIDELKAEKAEIQRQLDEKTADLKVSIDNHNRILSEKNRQMAAERERGEAEQKDAVAHAQIQKDIEYASDDTDCTRSDPVRRALRGLYDLEHGNGGEAVDRIPASRRSGKPAAVSGAAGSAEP